MIRTAAFLRNVPVFHGLSDELLDRLAGQVDEVRVPAAEWLMREGEAADSMFIVAGGRLDIVHEGPPETLIRVLRRGDVVGELALLRAGTRSASVRARRDSELLSLGREAFEELIQQAPSFALGLTRAMGSQLAASRSPVVSATPPRTIAVISVDRRAPADEVTEMIATALEQHGSVARVNEGGLAAIDAAERDRDRVVMRVTAPPGDQWTDVCVVEADLAIVVSAGVLDREWQPVAASLSGCELIVLGPSISDSALDALAPAEVQVIAHADRRRPAIEATARRLAGRSLGIVLSGGGARALAHLGVLAELHAAGVRFDRIAGVSLGALVAAAAADDLSPQGLYEIFRHGFVDTNPTSDFTLPAFSLVRGMKTRKLLQAAFGERRIEELPRRFFCLSCDLVTREPVLHRTGPIVDAVYPSLAIPGVFPPVATADRRLLVDGGVLDNLPVATMARKGEGPVIAVDVTGRVGQFKREQRPVIERLSRPLRRALTGSETEIPRLGETIVRTVTVGSTDTVASARIYAELVISPNIEGIGLMEWTALPRVYELGRTAAREALASDPDLGSRLGI